MTKIEFLQVRNVAFGLWNRSISGPDAENITEAWAQSLMRFDARTVANAITRIAEDKRRQRGDGTSPLPTVPEILQTINAQRDRSQRPLLRPPDITIEAIAELEKYADEATSEGRFETAKWYANAAAAYRAELSRRREGARPQPVPVDLAGVVKAAMIDNAKALDTRERAEV